ncbi:MAG TPA: potassium/proton antiporter [Paludibacteraceae bacterium]|nr:potassium/proton antiporter [Paludibacteraceae bacterium]HOU67518.1 potassium/proton antiporter [Paludibacteraceae bacterium]HQJ90335.1 potassium/proton antiporter [Paludibacteraceae bacterium]
MEIQIELVLLIVSILFFVSILADKAGYRFGVPTLLLFLAVGMLFGSDGLGIHFENIQLAQTIGTVALCIILFSGGMDTKIDDIRPVIPQGLILATLGVLLTAFFTGVAVWYILNETLVSVSVGIITALLLAATMSSTDSASVFSILRSKGLVLKNNLRPMLELESGSNDPMAYVLTITLIGIVNTQGDVSFLRAAGIVVLQLIIGAAMGFLLGKLVVLGMNKLKIENASLYPIMVLTCCVFIFASTYYVKGNSYLAVYIAGLVVGNSKMVHKRSTLRFFDGISWLSQLAMFLTLGLLVNPHELYPVLIPGLLISFVMIFITRPLSVFISLLPFRKMEWKDKTFVSWVGLRGAVPIIFAILTLAENVPHSRLIFNIVFLCTLVSLVVQGSSLPKMAQWLGVSEKPNPLTSPKNFDIELPEDAKSVLSEVAVNSDMLLNGNRLMDLGMPEKTLIIMVKRNNAYFVPTGKTSLNVGDKLLIITDEHEMVSDALKEFAQDKERV